MTGKSTCVVQGLLQACMSLKQVKKELYVRSASRGHLGELQVGTSQAPPVGLPEIHALILRMERAQPKRPLRRQARLDPMLYQSTS